MIKRISDVKQMEFLTKAPIYLNQGEAADFMQVSVRNLQYWESSGLLHREGRQAGRTCRYTRWDLVEINFIRSLICEHGFTVNSLKEKLVLLESPYYYDPDDIFWNNVERCWCSRSDIACGELNRIKCVFIPYVRRVFESSEQNIALETVNILRSLIKGRRPKKQRRSDKT